MADQPPRRAAAGGVTWPEDVFFTTNFFYGIGYVGCFFHDYEIALFNVKRFHTPPGRFQFSSFREDEERSQNVLCVGCENTCCRSQFFDVERFPSSR